MFTKLFTLLSLFIVRSYRTIGHNNILYKSLQLYIPTVIPEPFIPKEEDPEDWNHGEVPWDFDLDNKTKPITKPIIIESSKINPFIIM